MLLLWYHPNRFFIHTLSFLFKMLFFLLFHCSVNNLIYHISGNYLLTYISSKFFLILSGIFGFVTRTEWTERPGAIRSISFWRAFLKFSSIWSKIHVHVTLTELWLQLKPTLFGWLDPCCTKYLNVTTHEILALRPFLEDTQRPQNVMYSMLHY